MGARKREPTITILASLKRLLIQSTLKATEKKETWLAHVQAARENHQSIEAPPVLHAADRVPTTLDQWLQTGRQSTN